MAFTRVIHVVRCKNSGGGAYIDVEVTDGWIFTGPNGDQQAIDCPAANASPGTTRVSHFVTATNPSDSTSTFDFEVLDGVVLTFWNGDQKAQNFPGPAAISVLTNAGGFPSVTAAEGGFASGAPPGTRVGELTQITDGNVSASFDNTQTNYIVCEKCQGICFTGPNGDQKTWDFPDADEITLDTTQYNNDGSPPDNNDPNQYIRFSGDNIWTGNALIRMGPLWRIVNAHGGTYLLVTAVNLVIDFATTDTIITGNFSPASGLSLVDSGITTITLADPANSNQTCGTAQAWLCSVSGSIVQSVLNGGTATLGTFDGGSYPNDGSFPPWTFGFAWGSGKPSDPLVGDFQSAENTPPTYNDITRGSVPFSSLGTTLPGTLTVIDFIGETLAQTLAPAITDTFSAVLTVKNTGTLTSPFLTFTLTSEDGEEIVPPAPEFGI